MAIVMIHGGPKLTEAGYERVCREVYPENRPVPGLLYHAAGSAEDGFHLVEVWESQEAADRFFEETVAALLERAGIQTDPPQVVFAVYNSIQP